MYNRFCLLLFALMSYVSLWAREGDTIALADPTIFVDKGVYYLYGTSSNADYAFEVYRSTNLKDWEGPVGKEQGYALKIGDSFGTTGFWAPQIFKYKGKYYMAYTANEQIAIAVSDSPMGPFSQEEKNIIPTGGRAIDPYVFFDTDGKIYLYHVRLTEGNRIFVAEMNDDLQSLKEETVHECIAAQAKTWEDTADAGWKVAEGPTVLKEKGLYYLFYSANDYRNVDYAVGYAVSESPYGPWKRSGNSPIISRDRLKESGTGHGDVFYDRKGRMKYVFHTHCSEGKVHPRKTAVIQLEKERVSKKEIRFNILPETFLYLESSN